MLPFLQRKQIQVQQFGCIAFLNFWANFFSLFFFANNNKMNNNNPNNTKPPATTSFPFGIMQPNNTQRRSLPPVSFSLPYVSPSALGITTTTTSNNISPFTPKTPQHLLPSSSPLKSRKPIVQVDEDDVMEDMDDALERQLEEEDIKQNDELSNNLLNNNTMTQKKKDGTDFQFTPEQELEMERKRQILRSFSREQESRYEQYKTSHFKLARVRRVMQSVYPAGITQNMAVLMSGCAKLYVGDIIEHAKLIMQEWNDDARGPIQPKHIREAVRRLKKKETRKKFMTK